MKNAILLREPNRSLMSYWHSWLRIMMTGFILVFLHLIWADAQAQVRSISGTVSGEDGEGLPGVNVFVKGTTSGTVTDIEGKYALTINDSQDEFLVFSYVGYIQEEVAIGNQSVIDIAMSPDVTALSEIVVVGYGSMDRSNVTGAITTVEVEDIEKVSIASPIEALRGQVAGLQVIRTSGQPGSDVTFKIRGNNSLGASSSGGNNIDQVNQPIIVIDGVPMVSGTTNELNSADIESINVLKDAAAASIYGSSGANGVILITTKKGKSGKAQVTLNGSSGIVDLVQRPNVMTGDEWIQFKFDVFQAGDPSVEVPPLSSLLDRVEYPNFIAGKEVNWLDEVLRTGIQTNVGATVSGGNDRTNFYFSGNYFDETGPIEASNFKRYSLRFNGDLQITDWLKMGARVQLSQTKSDQRTRIVGYGNDAVPSLSALIGTSPYGNLYDEEGNYSKFATEDLFAVNPLHKFNESEFDVNVDRSYINPYINIDIIDGLTYTLNTFAEVRNEFMGRFQSENFTDDALNLAQIRQSKNVSYLLDNILTYKKEFDRHGLDVTAIYGFQSSEWSQVNTEARNTAADKLGYWGIHSAPQAQQSIGVNTSDWSKYYIAGRLGYSFDSRYNATVTVRRDASSRFLGDNRFGIFPSAALAWNAYNEDWWFSDDTFNMLKLRVSYGEMGNDNINPFSYQAGSYPQSIPPDGTDTGYGQGTVAGNKDLKWETSKQFNVGVDFGFFQSRLSGSIEAYQTRTEDVLLFRQIPGALNNGFEQYPSNIGETENKGLEVTLKGVILEKNDFMWNATVNWAMNRSTIIRLNELNPLGEPVDDPGNGWFIGEDFREIRDFKYEGVYTTEEAGTETITQFGDPVQPGDAKIADVTGDGNIDYDDRTFIGNPTPDWYGGINSTFSYKGLSLSVLIEAVEGVTRFNSMYGGYNDSRGSRIMVDYWTPENESAAYPRVGSNSPISNGAPFRNAIFTEDASFIALRNISLSYTLPEKWLDGVFIDGVTFTASGYNLKYWTDYVNSYSPEITNTDQYPNTRNITLGAKVTF